MHVIDIYNGFIFEGVTTWYQSVPGLNTLGTWEVISITLGSSRLIETKCNVICLRDNMFM
mgnify:CR=1 FL=1